MCFYALHRANPPARHKLGIMSRAPPRGNSGFRFYLKPVSGTGLKISTCEMGGSTNLTIRVALPFRGSGPVFICFFEIRQKHMAARINQAER
jgi:hypothetical protein